MKNKTRVVLLIVILCFLLIGCNKEGYKKWEQKNIDKLVKITIKMSKSFSEPRDIIEKSKIKEMKKIIKSVTWERNVKYGTIGDYWMTLHFQEKNMRKKLNI